MNLRTLFANTAAALACATSALGWALTPAETERAGRVSLAVGQVWVAETAGDEFAPAEPNWALAAGNRIATDSGARAELRIGPHAIHLAELTALTLESLDAGGAVLRIEGGSAVLRLREMQPGERWRLTLPAAQVEMGEDGVYRLDVDAAQAARVTVREGSASIGAERGIVQARAGETVTVDPQGRHGWVDAPPGGALEQWAAQRAVEERAALSRRYVSPQVTGFESLDAHGAWRSEPRYGTVWVPYGVASGWAPYRHGRWVWRRPFGWTWLDASPWGFATSHYGRWAFAGNRWVWVPDTFGAWPTFGPAWVAFVGGPGYHFPAFGGQPVYGWFPLAPGEARAPKAPLTAAQTRQLMSATSAVLSGVFANRLVPGAISLAPKLAFAGGGTVQPATQPAPAEFAQKAASEARAPAAPNLRGAVTAIAPSSARSSAPDAGRPLAVPAVAARPPASAPAGRAATAAEPARPAIAASAAAPATTPSTALSSPQGMAPSAPPSAQPPQTSVQPTAPIAVERSSADLRRATAQTRGQSPGAPAPSSAIAAMPGGGPATAPAGRPVPRDARKPPGQQQPSTAPTR